MNMKQSSTYSLCDAAQNGIHIFTFILSIRGVLKLSNVSYCRNKSNDIMVKEKKVSKDWRIGLQ